MSFIDEHRENIKRRITELHGQIKPLEDGAMHLGERHNGGPMIDTTQTWLARLKEYVVIYEKILASYPENGTT